jgi:hypothetical protein
MDESPWIAARDRAQDTFWLPIAADCQSGPKPASRPRSASRRQIKRTSSKRLSADEYSHSLGSIQPFAVLRLYMVGWWCRHDVGVVADGAEWRNHHAHCKPSRHPRLSARLE